MTNPIPEGSIVITPQQVYDKVNLLTDAVTSLVAQDTADKRERLEDRARLDRVEAKMATKADKTAVEKLEARVTAIEKKLWTIAGAAAALGGGLGSWLPTLLGH